MLKIWFVVFSKSHLMTWGFFLSSDKQEVPRRGQHAPYLHLWSSDAGVTRMLWSVSIGGRACLLEFSPSDRRPFHSSVVLLAHLCPSACFVEEVREGEEWDKFVCHHPHSPTDRPVRLPLHYNLLCDMHAWSVLTGRSEIPLLFTPTQSSRMVAHWYTHTHTRTPITSALATFLFMVTKFSQEKAAWGRWDFILVHRFVTREAWWLYL